MPDDELAPPQIRQLALELLRSGQEDRIRRAEELLGFPDRPIAPTIHRVATRLGMTYSKLYYLYRRDWNREDEKRKRAARKSISSIAGQTLISDNLGFSIWLPADWKIRDDNDHYDEPERPNELGAIVPRQSGLWSAEGLKVDDKDPAMVEIDRYELCEPLTSLELYERCRPRHPAISRAWRPHPPLTVDRLEGIRYLCRWATGYPEKFAPYQFSVFLVDRLVGWQIDCWSSYMPSESGSARLQVEADLETLKALFFHRVVPSFRIQRQLAATC